MRASAGLVPETAVHFYQDDDGTVPVKSWLEQLQTQIRKAFAQCVASIQRLALFGHELRRPHADFLRDGIYELRARRGRVKSCRNPISVGRWSGRAVTSAIRSGTPMKKSSTKKPEKTRDALRMIDRMVGDDPGLRRLIVEAGVNAHIAQLIYDARVAAGLTQTDLAKRIGTSQPVIARLEDSDYHGHSLNMLQRIAAALNRRLELRFVPGVSPEA